MLLPMWNGELAGSPYTDLYPSVWSLWATESWWGQWNNGWFNHPQGQQWSPSTVFWGTLIIPLKGVVTLDALYNGCLLLNRLLTGWAFYLVGRSWGKNHHSGLLWMTIIGMNPMMHGFAVEGIIEGTQLWPLGFWLWSIREKRWTKSVFFGSLIVVSNWYWTLCWSVLSIILGFTERNVWWTLCLSLGLTLPWTLHFLDIQGQSPKLDPDIYQAMGMSLSIPTPNILTPPNPFAISTYTGWTVCTLLLVALWKRTNSVGWGILGLGLILSMGFPWMQNVPVLGSMRFPYRMHLLTLVGICIILSQLFSEQKYTGSHQWWILIPLEFMLLSPVDWQIPSSPSKSPDYTAMIDDVVLELPGPLVREPGEIDPSRPRGKYLQYHQTFYGQPSPWTLGFNGLVAPNNCFEGTRRIDPHATPEEQKQPLKKECWENIRWVIIHNNNPGLNEWLNSLGFVQKSDNKPVVWHRATDPSNDSAVK